MNKRTTNHELGKSLKPRRVPLRQVDGIVNAESRMGRTPHLVNQLQIDLIFFKRQVRKFPLPNTRQSLHVHRRAADERAIEMMSLIGHDLINVRNEVYKVPYCRNAGNFGGSRPSMLRNAFTIVSHAAWASPRKIRRSDRKKTSSRCESVYTICR